jgi:predicted  nucleic acid-binding Zn-ribbon protein
MPSLEAAQQQLEAVVERLEAAARDHAILREECHRLRQELETAQEANRRLTVASAAAERRLDEAIARLDAVGGG